MWLEILKKTENKTLLLKRNVIRCSFFLVIESYVHTYSSN